MVKADAKRDYYADLELPPTAEHEDIKKQFRLLAKLYHPDRNPGHETEVVARFQDSQTAYEILSDPAEKKKYDGARQKHLAKNPPMPPPPRANNDPYGFSKPQRAATTHFGGTAPPPRKPQRQYTHQETPASAGAAKFTAFARAGNQTWDKHSYEEAARAEAAKGAFSHVRPGRAFEGPPRPPRPHPTAPRPVSSDMPNGANPGFPGMARTASARKTGYDDVPRDLPRSAYAHVYGTRSNTTQPASDHWSAQSPPNDRNHSPLRHTKSSEQQQQPESATRPGMFDRQPSRYNGGATHVRTDLKEGLYRSASVRNSPIDPQWEECHDTGPFGKPRAQQGQQRHRSASPSVRQASGSTANFSESESESSDDQGVHMSPRKKAQPRRPAPRPAHDGMEAQASFKNYTRVVHDESPTYTYPAPQSKHPTRAPFPDVTSPDDTPDHRGPFSASAHKPDPVFKPANFHHENWAERLRTSGSTSPTKASQKARGRARTNPATAVDPMDVDMDQAQTNGTGMSDLNDLKTAGPFGSSGIDGIDDLKSSLPFESRASASIRQERKSPIELRVADLPRPPKEPVAPTDVTLLAVPDAWEKYSKKMQQYMFEWKQFDRQMLDHFNARGRQMDENLAQDWLVMKTDGPVSSDVDSSKPGFKAGVTAYSEWLKQDKICHNWWEAARERHCECIRNLAHVRSVLKGKLDDAGERL